MNPLKTMYLSLTRSHNLVTLKVPLNKITNLETLLHGKKRNKEMHHIHLKKIILILNNMIQVLSSNIKILVFKAYTNTILP
jgi:hypothetical protein